MHNRGRWPIISIEFMDGQTREYEFSSHRPGGWEVTPWDLIVTEDGPRHKRSVRHVFPREAIRCFSIYLADPDLLDTILHNTDAALDLSDVVNQFQAAARREPGTTEQA